MSESRNISKTESATKANESKEAKVTVKEAKSKASRQTETTAKDRYSQIVRMSIVGIVANLALAAFKAVAGFLAGSIAVILDGVNSLTDAFASIATIIGEKIAMMRPSRKHPYGYGRIEYVTSIVISAFIIAAGIISLRESFVKVMHPSPPDYTALTITVLVVATVAKVALGLVFVRKGRAIKSQPLAASGVDAMYDAILTFSTLLCAIVCLIWGVDLDGWVGLVISFFVVKAGVDVLREAVGSIIGERPDAEMVEKVRAAVSDHEGVLGVYDIMIDTFGPESYWIACHIEVRDDMTATEIHELTRYITKDLYDRFKAVATIGIYASNSSGKYADIRKHLDGIVEGHPEVLQMHGFFVDEEANHIDFDIVVDFDHDAEAVREAIVAEMKQAYPDYSYHVITDVDYS